MAKLHIPKRIPLAGGLLLLACLTLAACEDRREPVKPRVAQTSSPAR
jgi:hypothetical protein